MAAGCCPPIPSTARELEARGWGAGGGAGTQSGARLYVPQGKGCGLLYPVGDRWKGLDQGRGEVWGLGCCRYLQSKGSKAQRVVENLTTAAITAAYPML